ncbi:hypothetical protein OH764_36395 (plasmid) [Burkholderia sp. M6-3]
MSVTMGYKMTHDSGFAPNPFHGVLTLATCKPRIRACREAGDWVAGFVSQSLVDSAARRGVTIPRDWLVYLMQIGEVLPLHDYFDDKRFVRKQPPRESNDAIALCGDNIYYLDHRGHYEQLENRRHTRAEAHHDTAGVNALVAGRFYYFGRQCFVPDGGWAAMTRAALSRGRTFYCPDGFAEKILRYLNARGIDEGVHGLPSMMEGTPAAAQSCDPSGRIQPFALPARPGSRKRPGSCAR